MTRQEKVPVHGESGQLLGYYPAALADHVRVSTAREVAAARARAQAAGIIVTNGIRLLACWPGETRRAP